MISASREMSEKGGASVIHSSISIPNENVSEYFVTEASLCSMSSGAAYLVTANDPVLVTVASSLVTTIPAIPKSHICGSPLRAVVNSFPRGGVGT